MSSKIDWCDETINPLGWGCYGPTGTAARPKPCSYCYAQRASRGPWAAQRGCPLCQQFIPHWHPEMLEKPRGWRKSRRIFVQSMGDLLHPETPAEHVQACIDLARELPRHTFIFLTKNPERYREFEFPGNSWIGATATNQKQWDRAIEALYQKQMDNLPRTDGWPTFFISAEPLISAIDPSSDCAFIDWLIIGADSTRGAKQPNPDWALELINAAIVDAHIPVFMKDNLQPSLEPALGEIWMPLRQFPEVLDV